VANPTLQARRLTPVFAGGPTFPLGWDFPFVFICIMCGAISGFHSLVSSGTTPKMVDKESQVRMIGYGSMLIEGLVGVVANRRRVAAGRLPTSISISPGSTNTPSFSKRAERTPITSPRSNARSAANRCAAARAAP
jgi:carbon starvation protein CstA